MTNTNFPRLEEISKNNSVVSIKDADLQLVTEVQALLLQKKIYKGSVDGIAGELTTKALADFKGVVWLSDPEKIGATTAKALIEITENHRISEQQTSQTKDLVLNSKGLGERTGRTLRLPSGEIVYQNEFVVAGIPLTWGEITKGCDPERIPRSNEIVQNIIKAAKGFGGIRDKYGSAIGINSAYRTPEVNQRIRGARNSQHINGLALDICPLDGDFGRLLAVVRDSDCVGLGRGMHRGFIHCDWRNGSRVVFDYM